MSRCIFILILCLTAPLSAQLPAFSGADGPGATATGGRGGDVYHVTNLEFDLNGVIPGSLKYGINTAPGSGRTIVFDVGGTIFQNGGGAQYWFRSGKDNITFAGQTAPGGITIAGVGAKFTGNNNVLRNIAVRPGKDPVNPASFTYDSFSLQLKNSIVDHVSGTWYSDEGISLTDAGANTTVQYSLAAEGLNFDSHSFGSIIATEVDATNYSYHHNLYAHNNSRMPRLGSVTGATGAVLNWSNNVVYNWINRAGYSGTDQNSRSNFVGNYYIKGPSNGTTVFTGGDVAATSGHTQIYAVKTTSTPNMYDNDKDGVLNDGVAFAPGDKLANGQVYYAGNATYVNTPFTVNGVGPAETAGVALQRVLDYGGANWQSRNAIDQRIVSSVRTGTGGVILDLTTGVQATEWATVMAQRPDAGGNAPFNRAANWDTDRDGLPNAWEALHGLDPSTASNNGDFDTDGYTNLEEYINELSEWPAPEPIVFSGATNARFAQITNWDAAADPTAVRLWQPSRFDEARITSGTVVVDAVSQHAGLLQVAPTTGQTAALDITAGWLLVHDTLRIAAAGTSGQVNLSGGALRVGTIAKGSGGALNITGGVLSANRVEFSLTNNGSVISPGDTIGTTTVIGDATLASGALAIDLASPTLADQLLVSGSLTLGGSLDVGLLDGFLPSSGSWVIATASSFSGAFTSITPGFSVSQDGANLVLSLAPAGIPGDFDGSGIVDAGDYTTWRDNLDLSVTLPNDPTPGTVTQADYDVWQANFGAGASAAAASTVPEPAALLLAIVSCGLLLKRQRAGVR